MTHAPEHQGSCRSRRDERSGTEKWNRRFDRIHAQSVCSNRPYPTSPSVFIGAAEDADVLTAEGKTMNGSAQMRQTVHRPAWGGRAGGSVSVLAPSGSKVSPRGGCGRTLANGTRGRRTHENFLRVARTGSTGVTHIETATRAPCSVTLEMTADPVAIHSRRRVETDAVRLPACATQVPELHRAKPHRPRWGVEGRKCPHCSRRIASFASIGA